MGTTREVKKACRSVPSVVSQCNATSNTHREKESAREKESVREKERLTKKEKVCVCAIAERDTWGPKEK